MNKQIPYTINPNGRTQWKAMLRNANPGDWIDLPIRLRSHIHHIAIDNGMNVSVETMGETCRATFLHANHKQRRGMLRDFEQMPMKHLQAMHKAAQTAGMI
jgi:hypothetical protein